MSKVDQRTIVIGGGPGGASAAIYLARFCHSVLLLDAPRKVPGRTAQALHLENVLGFSGPTPGPEYLAAISRQLDRFKVERRQELVIRVRREKDGGFLVCTDRPARYRAGYLVMAVGVHDVMPDVAEVAEYFGNSIFQCPTCNWYQTKEKATGIVSNDDGGITMALAFDAMQRSPGLCVLPDRPVTHFSPAMLAKAKERRIPVHTSPLIRLEGKGGKLRSVLLADGTKLELEILYIKLGIKRHDTFLDPESVPVKRNREGYVEVDFRTCETSIPNLFAVGPCNTGHDQVMVAAGQGVAAAMEIHGRILTSLGI